ncbi:MAG: hypothetical protein ACREHG_03435, partial [Candidatus Saccharimonadales bacterium]
IGDCAWATAITLLGYYVGSKIPGLDKYVLLLVLAAVVISFSPVAYHLIKALLTSRKSKTLHKEPDLD